MYADLLFLNELLNDCMILLIVKELNGYKLSAKRLLAGAFTGALISTLLAVFFAEKSVFFNLPAGIILCLCMIKITFYPKIKSLTFRLFLHTYAAAFILGGVMSFIKSGYSHFPAIAVSVISFLLIKSGIFLSALINKKGKNLCRISINFNNGITQCTALIDTGNMLFDKESNLPVSIITSEKIPSDFICRNWHTIGFNSLGCENGTLKIIYAPHMCIEYKGEKKLIKNAPLGVCDHKLSQSYQMIISPEIINKLEI